MANTTDVAAHAAVPSSADIERASTFAREPFLLDSEGPEALAPGTARRQALDAALAEIAGGAEEPSVEWRRNYSLLLGLERFLADEPPTLRDGAELSPHQVDALSGTLAELMAQAQVGSAEAGVELDSAEVGLDEPDTAEVEILDDAPDEDEDEVPQEADEPEYEEPQDWTETSTDDDEDEVVEEAPDDPGAARRFWFEHATGAGKTVAAVGFIEATRTGGVLILTHRRNLVDQFIGEISDRGYKERLRPPLLGSRDDAEGPVTVETYQWFVRNHKKVSDAYSVVICDEAHTALGEKTSACIRAWPGPVFIGMTATGALIARHVADLFPTQTSRFDLAQAARRGVISPLRCLRIPPGPGVRTIAKVPLRKGEVDQDFDQEELAALLDQGPFNFAIADLYKSRFRKTPGVLYTAGVQHAHNVAEAFRAVGINAQAVSGQTPKRELAEILAGFERGDVDVLCNAQLLAEGWNSPRATICMHLAPTASRRIYQQRVGRVTRRAPGKEAGLVIDFVHPATTHDETIVTLHSLLDRDVYRGGAIVVGPVRRGRGRKVRVERRIVPVSDVEEKRMEVLEREIWRIAVENLDYPEQHAWAALAGARVNTQGWRRARAMLQNDRTKELRRRFLLTCVQRNRNAQLRLKALGEIADLGDPDAFDDAIDIVGTWSREDKRAGTKTMLQALIDKRIGRRDQAQAWVWRLAGYTRELHEEYAVQRWPETKRLLGLLVNSSGRAHGRNARRLVHAARKQDRRLAVSLLAAAVSHTPEGEEVLRGARMRMARKPSGVARELLRNFPKGGKRRRKRKRGKDGNGNENGKASEEAVEVALIESENGGDPEATEKPRRRGRRRKDKEAEASENGGEPQEAASEEAAPKGVPVAEADAEPEPEITEDEPPKKPAKAKVAKPKKAKARTARSKAADKPKAAKKGKAAKEPKAAKEKAAKAKAKTARSKAAAKPKRKTKAKAKAAKADGSEAGQMNIPGTEGDPVAVGESDE
ncbi:MAG: DEAD/DEAH box helicase family protein [Actinobacteria bacterium]|nr:DEAD/DEAH box helicase family protein [Actinomycetota bacterium]